MFFKNHHAQEKPVYEKKMVDVWSCPSCIGWMQQEFTVSQNPACPFCTNEMVPGVREINVLQE